MDDSDQDYLTDYRLFFDEFYQSVELNNPLPVHIGKYNISEFEITGEIVSWCLEYLNYRKCPSSLIAPLCRSVQQEMGEIIRREPESCGYRAQEDDYQTLKLMQATINKLVEVCLRYRDNSKLCRLPPPPPVTPSVSASAAKNARRTMEDRHIVINDLHALFGIEGYGVASYYAVFDGHNGSDAAIYACAHVHQYLVESPYYPDMPEEAFKDAFLRADDRFVDKSNKENLKSGTTAVSILIRYDLGKVYVAWLGDSQAIVVNGRDYIQFVNPHRPDHLAERKRIEDMGGSVVFWGTWRVGGQLAVSRSIGDVDYKPYVTGEPDISTYVLTGNEDFLLLACDGLWDFVSEQLAVEKVYDFLKESKGDRSGVAKSLVTEAKTLGSKDNISVVVAWLDMSTMENGHFGQEPEADVAEDLMLPPVLRNLKPSPQITSAPPRLDQNAEQWLKTLPWSYADALRNPAPKKEDQQTVEPSKMEEAEETVEEAVEDVEEKKDHGDKDETLSKGEDSGDVAGEAESGEDSEEEWNYISGKENRQPNQQQKEELSREDMESQLNPNAAEFVPVFSTAAEPDIAGSPLKGMERSLENVMIPTANDFFKEICKRPSDIGENETSMNGDALTNLSTKAVYGDDSICLNNTSDSEALRDTNPFATSQVPNFVQDHFAELSAQEHFSLPDIGFKPFPSSQHESEIDFMVESDKSDLVSPISLHAESKTQVNDRNVNDISEITFGDGFNVEEIIRSKQESPLLRESPEPGLGPRNEESDIISTEEETDDKIHEFSSIQRVNDAMENMSILTSGLADGDSSHQGPETSVDSEPEQDDVLLCPIKKDDHKIEEFTSTETDGDIINQINKDFNSENFNLTDTKNEFSNNTDELIQDEICCLRRVVNEEVQSYESEVIPEKNYLDVEKIDKVEEAEFHSEKTESGHDETTAITSFKDLNAFEINKQLVKSRTPEPEESLIESTEPDVELHHNAISELEHSLKEELVEPSDSEIPEASMEKSNDELPRLSEEQNNKELIEPSEEFIHSDVSFVSVNHQLNEQLEPSSGFSQKNIQEPSFDGTKHAVSETCKEVFHSETPEPQRGLSLDGNEIEVPSNLSHNEVTESHHVLCQEEVVSDEFSKEVLPNRETFQEELSEQSIQNEVSSDIYNKKTNSVEDFEEELQPTDMPSYQQKEAVYDEDIVTSSTFHEPANIKMPIEDDVCMKKEVHEELICPIKLTPLTKENDSLEIESQIINEKEVDRKSDFKVNSEDFFEQLISPQENKALVVDQEELICPLKQICPAKLEEEIIEPAKELYSSMDFHSPIQEKVKSFIFGNSEMTNYIETNEKLVEGISLKGLNDYQTEDSVVFDHSTEKNSACPLRRTPEEEEMIQQESEDGIQNSSQDELFTDEMSSSMIDHGEEKSLPEAQSNQLDLVQELQFEVQEKPAEADNESDSGFEIINASEASTIEMEMRYQSEKEAGGLDEKLLLDKNEAESLEKSEELVNNEIELINHVSNEIDWESDKIEELVMVQKEDVVMESPPKEASEPLDRPEEELISMERTQMVNGTATPPATPPATPAPGLNEETETKEGLIAAAVAAAGVATAVAAGSAAAAVSESKLEEKKSPIKKTDSSTKPGSSAKAPPKASASKTSTLNSKPSALSSKPSTPISKPSSPSSKPPAKPSSPVAKTTAVKSSTLAAKPSTPTLKIGAKPLSKPSTPTGLKVAPSAAKPKPPAPTTTKPASTATKTATTAPKPAALASAKPTVSKTATTAATAKKPPAASGAKSSAPNAPARPAAAKPAATAAKPLASKPAAAKPAPTAAAKAPPSKPAPAKPATSTTKPSPTARPISAKSTSGTAAIPKTTSSSVTKSAAKPAPAKTLASAKPAAGSVAGAKPGAKPAAKAAAPAKAAPGAPLNKKPAAPTAIKKPTAPTDKSSKEASNKLTAKTALTKKIEEKKVERISKKEVIGENEEPPAQVDTVTTTNGHIPLIENGIPSTEIAEEAN